MQKQPTFLKWSSVCFIARQNAWLYSVFFSLSASFFQIFSGFSGSLSSSRAMMCTLRCSYLRALSNVQKSIYTSIFMHPERGSSHGHPPLWDILKYTFFSLLHCCNKGHMHWCEHLGHERGARVDGAGRSMHMRCTVGYCKPLQKNKIFTWVNMIN